MARPATGAVRSWSGGALQRARAEQAIRDSQIAQDIQSMEYAEALSEALRKAGEEVLNTVKVCLGCDTETVKISRCDHIKYAMSGCSVHWCYFCGKGFPEKDIYPHMSRAHGGYYGGGYWDKKEG
jgi:hypothetical protein